MKIFIFSDIHGRLEAAKILIKDLTIENPDEIWFLGDLLYNGPRNGVPSDYDPMGVANLLKGYKDKIKLVQGNCDSRVDAMVTDFSFPLNRREHALNRAFLLYHGDKESYENLNFKKDTINVYGHTHLYEMGFHEDDIYYLNPGSVGFPKGGREATYMVLEGDFVYLKSLKDQKIILKDHLPIKSPKN